MEPGMVPGMVPSGGEILFACLALFALPGFLFGLLLGWLVWSGGEILLPDNCAEAASDGTMVYLACELD